MKNNTLLRTLPKVDRLMAHPDFRALSDTVLLPLVREEVEKLREAILSERINQVDEEALRQTLLRRYHEMMTPSLQKVVNATGIIVHTNLGRSLIDPESFEKAKEIACAYNTLEYDMKRGKRGERYTHLSPLLSGLLGCEDVLVVNNNAAAVFLILNTFAKRKEVIVSRGELVEIGGSFRIPEVMKHSGAKLVEVGATNKTHLRDYEAHISPRTRMLMKVHKSNYSIEGFCAEVPFQEVSRLAKERGLIDYYDLGSAHLVDLPYGLSRTEPSLPRIMQANPSLLSFSGDKLFGSVQAGVIVGRKELIDKLKKNQLLRMLRVDKVTLSLLTEDIQNMLLKRYEKIPTLRMLFTEVSELKSRARRLQRALQAFVQSEIVETQTLIGGGSTPNRTIPSIALSIAFNNHSPNRLQRLFREQKVIGRIENEQFLLDLRSIREEEFSFIIEAVQCITSS